MTRRQILLLCVVVFFAAGCTVGPDYKRPEVSVPAVYRAAEHEYRRSPVPHPSVISVGGMSFRIRSCRS